MILRWALTFFVIAVIAAVFGFVGIVSAAVGIAKFLFYIFLGAAVVLFIVGIAMGHRLTHHR